MNYLYRDAVSRMVSWYDYNLYGIREERAVRLFGSQKLELSQIVKKYNATPEIEWEEMILRYSGQQQARFVCGYNVSIQVDCNSILTIILVHGSYCKRKQKFY